MNASFMAAEINLPRQYWPEFNYEHC